MKTEAAEQLAELQQKQRELQSLQQELDSAAIARYASEHSLSEHTDRSKHEVAEQHDNVKQLQKQLPDAHSKLSQVRSDTAEKRQEAAAQQEGASKNRQEVLELKAQLKKAQEEVASLADARSLLQQQLGERTILLGQKAHRIAHLTAQLNEAKGLPGSSPVEGESGCLALHCALCSTGFVPSCRLYPATVLHSWCSPVATVAPLHKGTFACQSVCDCIHADERQGICVLVNVHTSLSAAVVPKNDT